LTLCSWENTLTGKLVWCVNRPLVGGTDALPLFAPTQRVLVNAVARCR